MELNKLDLIQMDEKNYKHKKHNNSNNWKKKIPTNQQNSHPLVRSFAHSLIHFISVDATKINNEEVKACLQLQLLLPRYPTSGILK